MPASTSIARSRALAHCSFARPRPLLVRAPTSVARSRAQVHCSFARVRPPKALFVSSSQSHSYRTMPRSGPCAHAGFVVKVERDTERYFKDSEFEAYAAPAPPHLVPPPFLTRVRFRRGAASEHSWWSMAGGRRPRRTTSSSGSRSCQRTTRARCATATSSLATASRASLAGRSC